MKPTLPRLLSAATILAATFLLAACYVEQSRTSSLDTKFGGTPTNLNSMQGNGQLAPYGPNDAPMPR